ncbi:MAG TPA: ABC transporter ATP-binding protein [Croceibacterium sp.]
MKTPALVVDVRGLAHRVGGFALGPLDLAVPEGSITALVGPNGAGKTTLLDLLFGLGRAQHGRIEIAGLIQSRDAVAIKRRIGFVSPDLGYTTWGTVGSALDYLKGFYPEWSAAECQRLMDLFELERGKKIAGLSFGEKTRLSLIVALARDTDALLLDEPTTGLDVAGRRNLFAELLRYTETFGRAVVISSHQLGDLERLADRIALLSRGKLVAQGEMDLLVERFEQWDVSLRALRPRLPAGLRVLAEDGSRARLMADLTSPGPAELDPADIIARAPMTLEEVYLGLTGELA